MKRLFYFGIFLLLTSCFEMIEEVNLNADGSGTFKFTANFSRSSTEIATFMTMDTVKGIAVPKQEKIEKKIQEVRIALKNSKGISNASITPDFENFVFKIQFDFKNDTALNAGFENMAKLFGRYSKMPFKPYKISNGKMERVDEFKKAIKGHEKYLDWFSTANYITLYRFPSAVTTKTNSKAKISKNKKVVFLKQSISQLKEANNNLSNKINFTTK